MVNRMDEQDFANDACGRSTFELSVRDYDRLKEGESGVHESGTKDNKDTEFSPLGHL